MNREPDPQDSAPRRVEAYLDAVLITLPRRLSAFQVSELRRELRTHLWERVAAYEELGQTEDDAVTEALRQFGGGKDFVKQWRREWMKTPHRVTLRDVWEAARPMLRPSLLGLAVALVPFGLIMPLAGFSYLILPVLIGVRQGQLLPARAGLGMTVALTVELMTTSLLYLLCPLELSSQPVVSECFSILLALLLFWLPFASGAAALTGWWTRRARARWVA